MTANVADSIRETSVSKGSLQITVGNVGSHHHYNTEDGSEFQRSLCLKSDVNWNNMKDTLLLMMLYF